MKKYIQIIIVSSLVGVLFMYTFFNSKKTYEAYLFQVGFYESYDNALSTSKNLSSSAIIPNNNGYSVVVAMYENIDLINTMLIYYEEKDIDVIIKKVNCDEVFINELSKYEKIALNITNKSLYDSINQNILDLYMETL